MDRVIFLKVICVFLFTAEMLAQESGLYQIIVVNGHIINQQSGKELRSNEQVQMQTTVLFGSEADNAILRSPSQRRYRLASSGQLSVSSDKALREIKSRPLTNTDIRLTDEVSAEMLKIYFGVDTFAIVGNHLNIDVGVSNAQKYDLVFRFKESKKKREMITDDFVVRQSDIGHTEVRNCSILLREGKKITPITQVTILFVDEQSLHREFAAWLYGLEEKINTNYKKREELIQYCRDVYGVMDNDNMNYTIGRFLEEQ